MPRRTSQRGQRDDVGLGRGGQAVPHAQAAHGRDGEVLEHDPEGQREQIVADVLGAQRQ